MHYSHRRANRVARIVKKFGKRGVWTAREERHGSPNLGKQPRSTAEKMGVMENRDEVR